MFLRIKINNHIYMKLFNFNPFYWIAGFILAICIPFTAHARVVISEVLWVGSHVSTADEWIELTSDESIDISDWFITTLSSSGEKEMIRFPSGTFISMGQFIVISNYASVDSAVDINPDFVTSAVSLPNTKLLLSLYNSSGALIDQVDDSVGAPYAGGKDSGSGTFMSMEKIDVFGENDKSNWMTAQTSNGIDVSAPVLGTPGYTNGSFIIEVPIIGPSSSSSLESNSSGSVVSLESSSGSSSLSDVSSSHSYSSSSASSSIISSFATSTAAVIIPKVRISEVLANPKGKDDLEWIELINQESHPVTINGWILKVGKKEYELTQEDVFMNGVILFYKEKTKLSLRNAGDIVELWSGSLLIDELEYPETDEDISYGILYGTTYPLCFPTPGTPNTKIDQHVAISVQSGFTKGEGKVALNLQAKALDGSLNIVTCEWQYSDGFTNYSCNPPSHTFDTVGRFWIELRTYNMCGDYSLDTLRGEVTEKGGASSSLNSSSSFHSSISSTSSSSLYSSSAEILEYDFIPTISEIFPSPNVGDLEWIELFNPHPQQLDLTNWQLDDIAGGGSKAWTIPPELGLISSGSYLIFERDVTKLALNNTGDDVRLIDPNGDERLRVSFNAIKRGESYIPNLDCVSKAPTKGQDNSCINNLYNSSSKSVNHVSKNSISPKSKIPFLKTIYENIVPSESTGSKITMSPIFSQLQAQAAQSADVVAEESDMSFPFELLFFAVFVLPGWFLMGRG
jgi:hypothetical protein